MDDWTGLHEGFYDDFYDPLWHCGHCEALLASLGSTPGPMQYRNTNLYASHKRACGVDVMDYWTGLHAPEE